jgi:hypothetical protein
VAGAGETVVVPAGVPHCEENRGSADIDGVVALRPVLRARELLEAVAEPGGRRQDRVQGRDQRARLTTLARMT